MGGFLGDKGVFKSLTAWGAFLFTLGPSVVQSALEAGFITAQGADMLSSAVTSVGGLVAAIGGRKILGKIAAK